MPPARITRGARITFHLSLFTPHYSLLTPHSSLFTSHSSLLTIHFSLPHFSLITPHFPTFHLSLLTPHFLTLPLFIYSFRRLDTRNKHLDYFFVFREQLFGCINFDIIRIPQQRNPVSALIRLFQRDTHFRNEIGFRLSKFSFKNQSPNCSTRLQKLSG
ncbi:hypothetical protein BRDCF_p1466 [Bacteroidales bacterium CF]|nr:hypothetical protein BRDCF_p1466 [Bacteroidales bacterium CF]